MAKLQINSEVSDEHSRFYVRCGRAPMHVSSQHVMQASISIGDDAAHVYLLCDVQFLRELRDRISDVIEARSEGAA